MSIGEIVAVAALIGFLSLVLLRSLIWKDDVQLEKYFNKTYEEIKKEGYFLNKKISKPIVIIGTDKVTSKIRTFFKKSFKRLFTKEIPQVILVFGKDREEEREAYIIQQAFALEWQLIDILDIEFIESAINYFSYKFGSRKRNIKHETFYILRKDYESSAYRECLIKLDDIDFSKRIVINPPPRKKPLLRELIMPMVLDQNNQAKEVSLQRKEELKVLFMKICDRMHKTKCGVLFIGYLNKGEYMDLISHDEREFFCFLLCATGLNIPKLNSLFALMEESYLSNRQYSYNMLEGRLLYKNMGEGDYKRLFIDCSE